LLVKLPLGVVVIRNVSFGLVTAQLSDEVIDVPADIQSRIVTDCNRYSDIATRIYDRDYGQNASSKMWGAPSFIVRADMPPDASGYYEFDAAPSGIGIVTELGGETMRIAAEALRGLGERRIISIAGQSVANIHAEHSLGMDEIRRQGIEVRDEDDGASTIWLQGSEEDMGTIGKLMPRSLLQTRHCGGHKEYLAHMGLGRIVSTETAEELLSHYPRGFAIKPLGGTASRDSFFYGTEKPWRQLGSSLTRMNRVLKEGKQRMIAQPFFPPREVEMNGMMWYEVWRIFLVLTRDGYRLAGGAWLRRPGSLRLHGASDAVCGLLRTS